MAAPRAAFVIRMNVKKKRRTMELKEEDKYTNMEERVHKRAKLPLYFPTSDLRALYIILRFKILIHVI
jgi:hypothetical protein